MRVRNPAPAVAVLACLACLSLPTTAPRATAGEEGGVRLPAIDPLVLPSGTRLFLLPDPSIPLVTVHVRLPGGTIHDTPEQAGRAALLARWLRRGAGERSAPAFREAVQARGGTLTTFAAPRWIGVDAEFLAEDQVRGLGLVRDLLDRPRFEAAELERAKALAVAELKQLENEPSTAIGPTWNAWLFGAHPYGNPPLGTQATLAKVADPEALKARWKTVGAPANRWIAVTGDFDRDAVLAALSGTGEHEPAEPPALTETTPRKGGVLLVDHPSSLQTYFRAGGPGIERTDPDYPARYLANTILGGRFTSRLNTALRIESGLTYGANSWFDDERGGAFTIDTYTETAKTKACVDLARTTYRTFVEKGITADELASARAYAKGQFAPSELETRGQQAAWLLDLTISGLSRDFVDGFFARLDAQSVETVNRVIETRFPREPLAWTIIGRADIVRPLVGSLGEVTETALSDPGFGPR